MRQQIVAGNWKMHGSTSEVELLLRGILGRAGDITACKLVVFPPYVYLPQAQKQLSGSPVSWGAQNVCSAPKGPFTGEISTSMLRDLGCQYVLVGHSERRQFFAEDSQTVAKKYMAAAVAGIKPILCVGETRAQREAGDTINIVFNQINALLDLENGVESLYNGVIAYEPVWAIGTGLTATPEQAQEVHAAIRLHVAERDSKLAEMLSILYGGSMKRDNASALLAMPDIDGGLIGGASLDAQHFLDIAKLCSKY